MTSLRLNQISKCFRVYHTPVQALTGMIAPGLVHPEEIWALREIDLELQEGQCVGVIGDNGSGKSTLLKIMGGIVSPSEGTVHAEGRISMLLDLSVGIQTDLSGRANIGVLGRLLGLSGAEIHQRMDQIIDFSELGRAIDRPVMTYSQGMAMRLGFSIALQVDFDILLVDEVLAVGDTNFHRKCLDRLRRLHREERRTVVLVSHGLGDIASLTDHLIWLEQGRVRQQGKTEEILAAYWQECERLQNRIGRRVRSLRQINPYGEDTRHVRIEGVRFLDSAGQERAEFASGDAMRVEIWFNAVEPVEAPLFRVQLHRNDGLWVHGINTARLGCEFGMVEGRGCVVLNYGSLNLLEADYFVTVGVWPDEYCSSISDVAHDLQEMKYVIHVTSERHQGAGIVNQPVSCTYLPPGCAELEQRPSMASPSAASEPIPSDQEEEE